MKKYYPNNWHLYNKLDSSQFEDIGFDEFYEWKIMNWELPRKVSCIIRTYDTENHKVKEYVYRQGTAARKRLRKLMQEDHLEITIANEKAVNHLSPRIIE